jgi:hypothetical protein
LRRTI